MKLKHLITNKKIVIVSFAILLALIVAIAILATPDSKETGGKDANSKTEQNDDKDKTDKNDQGNHQDGSHEVLKPDEVAPEDSSDASGDWGDASESNNQTDIVNKKEPADEQDNQSQNDNQEDKEILKDNISWGEIY